MLHAKIIRSSKLDDLEGRINEWLVQNQNIYITNMETITTPLALGVVIFYTVKTRAAQGTKERQNNAEGDPLCPNCKREMRIKSASTTGNLFWGCSAFPTCRGTHEFTEEDDVRKHGVLSDEKPVGGNPLVPPVVTPSPGFGADDDDIPF